jgi:hypothetical protein
VDRRAGHRSFVLRVAESEHATVRADEEVPLVVP